jgi:hypothetical protein
MASPSHKVGLIRRGYRLYRYISGNPAESISKCEPKWGWRQETYVHPNNRDREPMSEILVSDESENG